jgi:hypothetical protein
MSEIDLEYSKIYLLLKVYTYSLLLSGISLQTSHSACEKLIEYFSVYCTFVCFMDSIYLCSISKQAKIVVRSSHDKYSIFRYNKKYIIYYMEFSVNLFLNTIQTLVYLRSNYEQNWIESIKSILMFWNIAVLVIFHYRDKIREQSIRNLVANYISVASGFYIIKSLL